MIEKSKKTLNKSQYLVYWILIKLLLSGKQILIVSLVFILLGNTTNLTFPNAVDEKTIKGWVNTAEATESNDKKVCEQYNGEWKKIADSGGERWCNFDNDKDRQLYSVRPGHSLDGTGSDAEYGRLDLDLDDVEAAAIEDDICDDEDADTTDVKSCMSQVRKHQVENNIDKEECKEVNGDWKNGGCTFYEDEQEQEEQQEEDYLSEENVDKSVALPGENEATETEEEKRFEEREFVAELEDDLVDAKTPEQKEKIQGQLDTAREKFGLDDKADEANDELMTIEAEEQVIEDYGNTVIDDEEPLKEAIKQISSEDQGNRVESSPVQIPNDPEESEVSEEQEQEEVADNNEVEDNQVNTDTEDSSDNTDSSDSQDSSDSEDNSSDDGGDSSDNGDDSSSSDDGGG